MRLALCDAFCELDGNPILGCEMPGREAAAEPLAATPRGVRIAGADDCGARTKAPGAASGTARSLLAACRVRARNCASDIVPVCWAENGRSAKS